MVNNFDIVEPGLPEEILQYTFVGVFGEQLEGSKR